MPRDENGACLHDGHTRERGLGGLSFHLSSERSFDVSGMERMALFGALFW